MDLEREPNSGGVSSSLVLQIWESPFSDFCLFSVAFTTPRTAVFLDRLLLESDKLFRTVGNMYFLNLLLDSKECATFLRIGKHFEKMILPQKLDEKRVCKVVYFPRGRAARQSREL